MRSASRMMDELRDLGIALRWKTWRGWYLLFEQRGQWFYMYAFPNLDSLKAYLLDLLCVEGVLHL